MPFDAGLSHFEPSLPKPVDEPIDWIDWVLRIVVMGPLLVLYTAWMGHVIWSTLSVL